MRDSSKPSKCLVVGFLCLLAVGASARHYKVYVLTGQSNSLGYTNTQTNSSPGFDPADGSVRFWWENWSNAVTKLGDCTNTLTSLMVQQGGAPSLNSYANNSHWGPEIGFGRMLYKAGERDFMVVKCSRNGGGNSYWDKFGADPHMYKNLSNAVCSAVTALESEGHTFEIAGLLYLQGEGNTNNTEANDAGNRFNALLTNLQSDLPHATRMRGYIAGIAKSPQNTLATTLRRFDEIYGARAPEIVLFDDLDLADEVSPPDDNVHFIRSAKLCIGARFADAVQGRLANYDATLTLTNADPVLQGWSQNPTSLPGNVSASGTNAWQINDQSSGNYLVYSRTFSSNLSSWANGLGWSLSVRSRLLTNNSGAKSWVMMYGDLTNRWALWAEITNSNQILLSWTNQNTLREEGFIALSNYQNDFHEFRLHHKGGNGNATVLLDGVVITNLPPFKSQGGFPQGIHWGAGVHNNGKVQAEWEAVSFALDNFSILAPKSSSSNTVQVQFASRSNYTYALYRSTNLLDWSSLSTNLPGNEGLSTATDNVAPISPKAFYRVRMNP